MRVIEPSVELMFITPNAAQLLEAAGRTCYKSEDRITADSADKFVRMIDKRGHHSVLEHAYATFRVITDRGITHEIVRHRIASYSQESTRYCNYSKSKFGSELTLLPPSGMSEQEREIWMRAANQSEQNYNDMISVGSPPQRARGVLLTNQKTEIVVTYNFREWLHFLKLRTAEAAHPDMRIVAKLIEAILIKECPTVFRLPLEQEKMQYEYDEWVVDDAGDTEHGGAKTLFTHGALYSPCPNCGRLVVVDHLTSMWERWMVFSDWGWVRVYGKPRWMVFSDWKGWVRVYGKPLHAFCICPCGAMWAGDVS